jgi:hypothetical protein
VEYGVSIEKDTYEDFLKTKNKLTSHKVHDSCFINALMNCILTEDEKLKCSATGLRGSVGLPDLKRKLLQGRNIE